MREKNSSLDKSVSPLSSFMSSSFSAISYALSLSDEEAASIASLIVFSIPSSVRSFPTFVPTLSSKKTVREKMDEKTVLKRENSPF